jgi:DNA-binding GntR family transcriptional regulator
MFVGLRVVDSAKGTDSVVLTGDAIRVAVPNWCSGTGPVYVKLADALRRAIQSGELPAGAKLPSERQLALSLAASRSTIVAAYKLLTDDGVVSRRQGSGTWISTANASARSSAHSPSGVYSDRAPLTSGTASD